MTTEYFQAVPLRKVRKVLEVKMTVSTLDRFSSEYPDGDFEGGRDLVISIRIVFKAKTAGAHSHWKREVRFKY